MTLEDITEQLICLASGEDKLPLQLMPEQSA